MTTIEGTLFGDLLTENVTGELCEMGEGARTLQFWITSSTASAPARLEKYKRLERERLRTTKYRPKGKRKPAQEPELDLADIVDCTARAMVDTTVKGFRVPITPEEEAKAGKAGVILEVEDGLLVTHGPDGKLHEDNLAIMLKMPPVRSFVEGEAKRLAGIEEQELEADAGN